MFYVFMYREKDFRMLEGWKEGVFILLFIKWIESS